MLFNSYIFVFVFLPITLFLWYFLHAKGYAKAASVVLIGMSLWFYGYFHVSYLLIILVSCFVNYSFSCMLEKGPFSGKSRFVEIIGVVFNLALLGYFKYYDFFLENLNSMFHSNFALKNILLPLGISFFTFQQLSFVIDRCRKDAPHYSLLDYLAYVTFFPQLIAGPIVLHSEFMPQLKRKDNKSFDCNALAYGICWFVFGLSKKILIADHLAKAVDAGFATLEAQDTISTLFLTFAFALELYFDFSGYCDMAIGIGKMFRIELPDNFNGPYQSASVKEFWRRWHMTLGRFFTRYVYIPLGGNRKGKRRTFVNTMIVFTLSGLWHGANWTFVVWGILHGLGVSFSLISEKWNKGLQNKKSYMLLCKVVTFFYVSLAFVIFRADSVKDAIIFFKNMFAFENKGAFRVLANSFVITEVYPVTKLLAMKAPALYDLFQEILFCGFMLFCILLSFGKKTRQRLTDRPLTTGFAIKVSILFVWAVISFSQVSTFLYFNF